MVVKFLSTMLTVRLEPAYLNLAQTFEAGGNGYVQHCNNMSTSAFKAH